MGTPSTRCRGARARHACKVRALALAGKKRQPTLPEVPTFAEAGLPKFDVSLWQGAPRASRHAARGRRGLNREINKVLAMPEVRDRISELGADPAGTTPEEFAALIDGEIGRWDKLVTPDMRRN